MKEGPDIAVIGALIGDPARANMLVALMTGKALTATELAQEAGITPQTASAHLARLEAGGLVRHRKQGRHRYHTLTGDDVGQVLESLMGLAAKRGHLRVRTGPRDPELRKARVCYNHLAGELGVRMFESLQARGCLSGDEDDLALTDAGRVAVTGFGIDLGPLDSSRRPLCRSCLDWSARRSHLAGALGTALLDRVLDLGWARRAEGSRIVAFTDPGETAFRQAFPV
ncbi:MAG: metalloregulator ArsR/SmtB family transcription factor [Pseudomonadota bacterium]|nr:metalloregulator ArsR/SmtB family transcription factor [Pseudomonadota bacterium]